MIEEVNAGLVRGYLHRPDGASRGGIVLGHGAGSDCRSKLMIALAEAFAEAGLAALRVDLVFRQTGRRGPPHPSTSAADRDGLREAARFLGSTGPVYLGGHSYGGRQASMLAAEDPEVCRALLLLSYPLHPPARPGQMRTAHWPGLTTPSLFVHGTRDPFGTPEEMTAALELIPAAKQLHLVAGAAHELKPVISKPGEIVELFFQTCSGYARSAT